MHHRCVKGLLFFCRGQYQYIESARGPTFFSRRGIEATSTLRASALYRHAEIDRRRFFSREASKTGHARNSGRKRRTIRQSERVEREARAREREEDKDRETGRRGSVSNRERTSTRDRSRGRDSRGASFSLPRGIPRRIVSDSGDLYLPAQGRPLFLPIGLIVRGDDGD